MDQGALALAAHRDNRIEDALAHYLSHLQEQPHSGEGWFALGLLHQTKLGQPDTALHCYRRAGALMANPALADLHLGALLCELDRQEEAILHLARHIDTDPAAGGGAFADLACAHVRLGQTAQAADVAARYRARHPDDHFAPFLAAWVAAAEGRWHDGLAHVADCILLDPMWPIPLGLRGLLLWRLGRQEEATRVLQEMVTLHGNLVSAGVSAEERMAATRLWRRLRADAKRQLGLHEREACDFIVLNGGIGDQFCMAGMLSSFRAARARGPLVVVAGPRATWEALFPRAADLFVHIEMDEIRKLALCNRFFPDHPYTNFFPWYGPLVSLFSVQDLVRFNLGLPAHARSDIPTIAEPARREALDRFAQLGGRPGRSVLISPVSNSNPLASRAWWQGAVDALAAAGFTVFQNMTNMTGAEPADVLAPAVPVALPLEQAIPFCEAGGHFLGIRSGLCDLLGFAQARMKAVHARQRYARNDRYPLSVWLDGRSGLGMKRAYASPYWEDVDVDRDAGFEPAVIGEWLK
jgi:tetratricopeptide (TPR) repeat protein